jgi:putative ubiquitin-RnfH superfamily antitoxin RatB of RatAB toxin-antitoxin module
METLQVEVVYALPDGQTVLSVQLPAGATVAEAIAASGICGQHPEIDLARQAVGVFGRRVSLDRPLRPDDRVEIYRSLTADPKTSRRRRAAKRRR